MNIDRTSIRLLRDQIESALAALGTQHNLAITVGGASFLPGKNVTFKLECAVIGADGEVASKDAEAFKTNAIFFGLKAEDLGREFTYNGKRWTITGCAPRSRKFPILCEDHNGKTFKLPAHAVKQGLGS